MEEIQLNGKKYLLKEDVGKEFVPKDTKVEWLICAKDSINVIGVGYARLEGTWVRSRYKVEYLKRVVDALSISGIEAVDVVFTKNSPIVFGEIKDNAIGGFILAPRIDNN